MDKTKKNKLFNRFATLKWVAWIIFILFVMIGAIMRIVSPIIFPVFFVCMGIYDLIIALTFKKAFVRFGVSSKDYDAIGIMSLLLHCLIGIVVWMKLTNREYWLILLVGGIVSIGVPFLYYLIKKMLKKR